MPSRPRRWTSFGTLITCHESQDIGVVLITGEGPSPKDGGWAFCSGGDQNVRSNTGYKGENGVNRFNILDVQRQIRFMNKVVIAVVPGWAVGGGHSLHVVCDMTIASRSTLCSSKPTRMWRASTAAWLRTSPVKWAKRPRGLLPRRILLGARGLRDGHGQRGAARQARRDGLQQAKEIMTKSPTASRC